MTDLISVIIPVYKVEEYLDVCIESVVNQSYRNLQIILVDDGSPDNSGKICDQWAVKDSRIQVIHKHNGGLSDARNAGLAETAGEYISFIDSDDYVSPFMIEELWMALKSENADIVECNYQPFESEYPQLPDRQISKVRTYSPEDALALLLRGEEFAYPVWNKLYRKGLFETLNFEKGKLHEDVFFTYKAFGTSKRICKVNSTMYFYRQRAGSIMGSKFTARNLDALHARREQYEYILKNYPNLRSSALYQLLCSCLYFGQLFVRKENYDNAVISTIKQIYNENYKNESLREYPLKQRIWLKLADINLIQCCRIRNTLNIGL